MISNKYFQNESNLTNFVFRDGYTLAVVDKTCATGYFSLGHEIAHSFGCMHDK